jgi:hypothetical protein
VAISADGRLVRTAPPRSRGTSPADPGSRTSASGTGLFDRLAYLAAQRETWVSAADDDYGGHRPDRRAARVASRSRPLCRES